MRHIISTLATFCALAVLSGCSDKHSFRMDASDEVLSSIEFRELSQSDTKYLRGDGYEFIVPPVEIKRDGERFLDEYATIGFKMSEKALDEGYDRYLGVSFEGDRRFWYLPDDKGFKDDYLEFEIGHLSTFAAVKADEATFISILSERKAEIEWLKSARMRLFADRLKELVAECADSIGFTDNEIILESTSSLLDNNDIADALDRAEKGDYLLFDKMFSESIAKAAAELTIGNGDSYCDRSTLETLCQVGNITRLAEKMGADVAVSELTRKGGEMIAYDYMPDITPILGYFTETDILTGFISDNIVANGWNSSNEGYMKAALIEWNKKGVTTERIKEILKMKSDDADIIRHSSDSLASIISVWEKEGILKHGADVSILNHLENLFNERDNLMMRYISETGNIDKLLVRWIGCNAAERDTFPSIAASMGFRDMKTLDRWLLVETKVESQEASGSNLFDEIFKTDSGCHTYTTSYHGRKTDKCTFTARCTVPKDTLHSGMTDTLNVSITTSGGVDHYLNTSVSLIFDLPDMEMGTKSSGAREFRQEDITQNFNVGSHGNENKSANSDFTLSIPEGKRGERMAISFTACGSRTQWIYEWSADTPADNGENDKEQK